MNIETALEIETVLRSHKFRGESQTKKVISALLMVIDHARAANEPDPVDDECGRVVELYRQHLPTCRGVEDLTPQRKRSMIARWSELQKGKPREKRQGFLDFWEAVFKHAAKSDFITGRRANDRGWAPTIDFFLQRSSLMKLREGAYHADQAAPVGAITSWI